jgi:TonB family protein
MRKKIQLFVLLSAVVIWQSCGSKSDTTTADMADSVVVTDTEIEQAKLIDENKKTDEIVAKRAQLEKSRVEKAQERMLAATVIAEKSPTYKDSKGRVVYNKAEIDPSFTGGEKAMRKYLRDNLKYPENARDNGIEGTVFVNFIVDEKGKVREVVASDVVGENIDQELKDESVRVVTSMPVWVAGRQHGKNVDVNFSIPISFELSN